MDVVYSFAVSYYPFLRRKLRIAFLAIVIYMALC
jgi:hypothetical protein